MDPSLRWDDEFGRWDDEFGRWDDEFGRWDDEKNAILNKNRLPTRHPTSSSTKHNAA